MEGKIITCCGDCVHYDWRKHKCRNGHNDESNPRKHFYSDCKTLEDLAEHDKQVRAEVIEEFLDKVKELYPNDSNALYKFMCIAEQLKEKKQ